METSREGQAEDYQLLFDSNPQPLWVYDVESFAFLAVNNAAVSKYDYAREEFLALTLKDIFRAEDVPSLLEDLASLGPDLPYTGEWQHVLKSRQVIDVEVSCRGLEFAGRKAALMVAYDITDRKREADDLRKREERSSRIFHISPAATSLTTVKDGRFVDVNASALRLFGYTRDEMIGRTATELGLWTNQARERIIRMLQEQGSIRDTEIQFHTKTGEARSLYGAGELIQIGDEMVILMSGADITKRKQAEDLLRIEKAYFEQLFESAPEAIAIVDNTGHVLRINGEFTRMFGYTSDEALSQSIDDLVAPGEVKQEAAAATEQAARGERVSLESVRYHKDGTSVHVSILGAPVVVNGGQLAIYTIYRDITKRKQAEQALRQLANRLQILHEIDRAILRAESAKSIAQGALQQIRQLVPCLGGSITLVDRENQEAELFFAEVTGTASIPTGTHFPLKTISVAEPIVSALQQGEVYILNDLAVLARIAPELRPLSDMSLQAIYNFPLLFQNELTGVLSIGVLEGEVLSEEHLEIVGEVANQLSIAFQQARLWEQVQRHAAQLEQRVEERTSELQAANESLAVLSRVKDEFVSDVSHELRTPITSLKLYLRLLKDRPDKWVQYHDTLTRETQRLENLIEDLLSLSRLDQGRHEWNPQPVSLNQLCENHVNDRAKLAEEKRLSLTLDLTPDLPSVQADPGLIEQALSILLTNAMNYTLAGGKIEVATLAEQQDGLDWVGLSIRDNGPGIPADELPHLSERFFRGRLARNLHVAGTGLGLSIVKQILDQHQGRIEIDSTGVPGEGAAFTIWLKSLAPPAD